uniref:Cyclin-dependent kinase inhibitor 7 n=1 Tax=Rhizophora mucronata TaxID=61149 RepID=A0A2P2J050_RHIMU
MIQFQARSTASSRSFLCSYNPLKFQLQRFLPSDLRIQFSRSFHCSSNKKPRHDRSYGSNTGPPTRHGDQNSPPANVI